MFLFIGSLFFWTLNKHRSEYEGQEVNVWESMREGVAYIYKTKEILGALTLDLLQFYLEVP